MLAHFRGLPQSCTFLCQRRAIFASISLHQDVQGHQSNGTDERLRAIKEYSDHGYKSWVRDLADKEWRTPKRPRNWLQQHSPYPANPSFRPPAPISDALRTKIYQSFMADPQKNNIHELGARHNLSLKRVQAILRLKGLEAHWIKGKTLQTGFQYGMEKLLDIKTRTDGVYKSQDPEINPRYDAQEADAEYDEGGTANDLARQRYQRFFFESVVDGETPIMPSILQKAKDDAAAAAVKRYADKSAEDLVPRFPDFLNNPPPVQLVEREGRPAVRFVDVGGKFLDVRDRKERIKAAERRKRAREKKLTQKRESKRAAGGSKWRAVT